MIRDDKQEEEERWRDRLEYLACFWNKEAVDQVQQSRRQEEEGQTSEEQFDDFLKDTFGQPIGDMVPTKE